MVQSYPYLSRVPANLLTRANRCMICRVFGDDETRLELSYNEPGLYDPLALVGLYPTFEAAQEDAARNGVTIDGEAMGR